MVHEDQLKLILGYNIKKYRKQKNLTQARLAEISEISITQLANLERGKAWVSCETAVKLSNALQIETFLLFISSESKYMPAELQLKDKTEKIKDSFRKKLNSFSQDFEAALDNVAFEYNFDHSSRENTKNGITNPRDK
ncbi:MAG: helix-turn-helix domain-containing protein [Treponema sp.]|jgi:transcriptional regulator with XRE-family HTH domain|nr:helix-turn-helix domain-containing protein [Treponema sp.]